MKPSQILLGLSAAAFAFSAAGSALADGEVSLLYARSITSTKYGQSGQQAVVDVLVQNLAYDKGVYVHLRDAATGDWTDLPAQYLRDADGGREIWRATFSRNTWDGNTPEDLRFALKYDVAGAEYWDNNGGNDYLVGHDQGSLLVGENVYDSTFADAQNIYADTFTGQVTLKNLAYAKQVEIVYTVDGWQTQRQASAAYSPNFWYGAYSSASNPNALGAEEWTFGLDVSGGSTVEYAIAYTVDGQTYWDNNFGHNYRATLVRP